MAYKVYIPESEDSLLVKLMKPGNIVMAGGTDLMVRLRKGVVLPEAVISLTKIPGMKEIEDLGNKIRLGCKVTYSQILDSKMLSRKSPLLIKAIRKIGSPQIRNRGTLIGNIVNASPAGDSIIPMVLSNSILNIRGPKGDRKIDLEDFIIGPGKTTLSVGEYVRSIDFESTEKWSSIFYKVGQRNAMTIATASVGILFNEKNIRIAFGSVAPTVVRAVKVEKLYEQHGIEGTKREEFINKCLEYISPIDDVRASAWYRREVIKGLIERALKTIERGDGYAS
ncbi:MAG: xanthine dehydrogenase family protein subunit M [Kosmotogaceae bacterium]